MLRLQLASCQYGSEATFGCFYELSSFFFKRIFASLVQISDDIKDAIVYLDAGSTECFEFLGAFSLLFELGAHAICSLEKVSPLDKVCVIILDMLI